MGLPHHHHRRQNAPGHDNKRRDQRHDLKSFGAHDLKEFALGNKLDVVQIHDQASVFPTTSIKMSSSDGSISSNRETRDLVATSCNRRWTSFSSFKVTCT